MHFDRVFKVFSPTPVEMTISIKLKPLILVRTTVFLTGEYL